MDFTSPLVKDFQLAVNDRFNVMIPIDQIIINETRKEFEGDFTIVLFPFVKLFGKPIEEIGQILGQKLVDDQHFVQGFNVVKGFLNITLSDSFWLDVMDELTENPVIEKSKLKKGKVLVEFASPNTNKPLHLGHIRNILLGWSMSKIYEANGYDVIKTQVINDRGIAICKSMYAWKSWGNGATPESLQVKEIILWVIFTYYLKRNFKKNTNYGNNPMMHKSFFLKMVNSKIKKNFSKAIKTNTSMKKVK